MRTVELSICALLLAAGGGWAIWLTTGYRPSDLAAAGLVLAVAASFVTYFATDRKRSGGWIRFGIYSAGLSVSVASFWTGFVRPLRDVQWRAILDWLEGLDDSALIMLVLSGPAVAVLTLLWCGAAFHMMKEAAGGEHRRRAKSDLHGRAALLDRRSMRRLAKRRGILLGQWGERRNAPLIGWSLEGSAITVAPPRAGKGALIALNLLSPEGRGFNGSTVTIDPRGELWCIASRRRRQMGRRSVLIDPFGVVRKHREDFDECHLPEVRTSRYNPLSFIRDDEGLAVRDINVLLDALLTPPRPGALENSRHFYESARAIIAGYIAWVRFREPREFQTLGMVHRMLSMGPGEREEFADLVRRTERFAGGLAHIAVERQAQVGKEEGGSNFSTIANQLSFLNYPELLANTSEQRGFNPLMLADGNTDLFVVVPEDTVEHVKGWLRLWVAIPNAVASIRPLERDMLIVIDEMPRLGYLKPVMDGYTMAAGKGVHFWCFAQSISALDSTWGKEHRKTLLDLAEVVQILGFPRTDVEGAEEMSKAIGTATFEGRTESRSGTVADGRVAGNTQWQAGESFGLVRERLVTPDELMTLGPDRQYVIGAARDIKRDALHLHHAHYWERPDTRFLADPNPFVLRKEMAAANAAAGGRRMAAAGGVE